MTNAASFALTSSATEAGTAAPGCRRSGYGGQDFALDRKPCGKDDATGKRASPLSNASPETKAPSRIAARKATRRGRKRGHEKLCGLMNLGDLCAKMRSSRRHRQAGFPVSWPTSRNPRYVNARIVARGETIAPHSERSLLRPRNVVCRRHWPSNRPELLAVRIMKDRLGSSIP